MVTELGDQHVGIVLDTVNSFGAEESPSKVLQTLGPLTLNLHLKDYVIRRASHQMGLLVEGCAAGEGRLDIPQLVSEVESFGQCQTAILEFWLPPEEDIEATLLKERDWAERSVHYLKGVIEPPAIGIA